VEQGRITFTDGECLKGKTMTHDEENDRNEKWLRRLLDGLSASNSSAEEMAQRLYVFAHSGRAKLSCLVRKGDDGRWYTSQHGDADVTGVVAGLL
jgi:hypothetical protein